MDVPSSWPPTQHCLSLKREAKVSNSRWGRLGCSLKVTFTLPIAARTKSLLLLLPPFPPSGSNAGSCVTSGNWTCVIPTGERTTFQLDRIPDLTCLWSCQNQPWHHREQGRERPLQPAGGGLGSLLQMVLPGTCPHVAQVAAVCREAWGAGASSLSGKSG